jgi:hypothetical protein
MANRKHHQGHPIFQPDTQRQIGRLHRWQSGTAVHVAVSGVGPAAPQPNRIDLVLERCEPPAGVSASAIELTALDSDTTVPYVDDGPSMALIACSPRRYVTPSSSSARATAKWSAMSNSRSSDTSASRSAGVSRLCVSGVRRHFVIKHQD